MKEINKEAREFAKKIKMTGYKTIAKFIKSYPENWKEVLYNNPYKIMEISGVGFIIADKIAEKIDFPKDDKHRIIAYVDYALDTLSKGSTVISFVEVLKHMTEQLLIPPTTIMKVLSKHNNCKYRLLKSNFVTTDNVSVAKYITKESWYQTEKDFYTLCLNSSRLPKLKFKNIKEITKSFKFTLNKKQKLFIDTFFNNGLNILTGVSGGGKTLTTKLMLDILSSNGQTFTNLTPTGIASKVFTLSTNYSSSTIHRYYYSHKGEKINTDWLILDECSMHSIQHLNLILSMVNISSPPRLLFIGDTNQLTPISIGDPFYSLIRLIKKHRINGNIVQLTEVMRASSELFIPHLCNMFVDGKYYDSRYELNRFLAGVDFIELEEDITTQIEKLIKDRNFTFDNTLILIPQNVGEYGNNIINQKLDEIIANNEILYQDKFKVFRKGSYCMNVKNNMDLDIYNGERIILLDCKKDTFICKKIDDDVIVEYDKETFLNTVQLSYSLTVHKTQGISVDNIIFIASKKHFFMLTRELIYTALSRARKKLIIIKDDNILNVSSKRVALNDRNSFLRRLSEI